MYIVKFVIGKILMRSIEEQFLISYIYPHHL